MYRKILLLEEACDSVSISKESLVLGIGINQTCDVRDRF